MRGVCTVNGGAPRGAVMSRNIVDGCVSGCRAQLDVSGLRGRCPAGPVPVVFLGGFVVLADRRAFGVVDGYGGGGPDDVDFLAGGFVTGVELVGKSSEVPALGDLGPHAACGGGGG